jgi:hypothetical protein
MVRRYVFFFVDKNVPAQLKVGSTLCFESVNVIEVIRK